MRRTALVVLLACAVLVPTAAYARKGVDSVPLSPQVSGSCPTNISWTAQVGEVPGQAILVVLDRNSFTRSWTPAEHAGTVGGTFVGIPGGMHQAVITRYVNSVVQEHHDIDVLVPLNGCGL
jgi:hypothetical protein